MYSKLHRPEKNELGVSVNAGSCVKLAHYLDKESGSGKFFFSQNQDSVPLTEVIQKIDNNNRLFNFSDSTLHHIYCHLQEKTGSDKKHPSCPRGFSIRT